MVVICKILIVYEEGIKDSIACKIDWLHFGYELVGVEMCDDKTSKLIIKKTPDIIILETVFLHNNTEKFLQEINEEKLNIGIIVISDSDNFSYVKKAMQNNVKHYLVRPFKNEDVLFAISDEMKRIKDRFVKNNFNRMVNDEFIRLEPLIKEQIAKDYLISNANNNEEYFKYFDSERLIRVVLFEPEINVDFETLFALKNMIEGYFGADSISVTSIVKNYVLVASYITDEESIMQVILKVVSSFDRFYVNKLVVAYSEVDVFYNISKLYKQAEKYLSNKFYSDEENILSKKNFLANKDDNKIYTNFEYSKIENSLKECDYKKLKSLIYDFFDFIEGTYSETTTAKLYCTELLILIVKNSNVAKLDQYLDDIIKIQQAKSITTIKKRIMLVVESIEFKNDGKEEREYNPLIQRTIVAINENLSNERLSLRWLANNMLFANVDYLGKLFKREIGENFSRYVVKKRIEMAKRLIERDTGECIYELATMVGYGKSSQYFSQVFKKHTGLSPFEYKEKVKMERR